MARSATTKMMTCDSAGARHTTGRSSSIRAGAAALATGSGSSIGAGSGSSTGAGSATNVSPGSGSSIGAGSATNVSSGSATNVSIGWATKVSSGSARNVSSGSATKASSRSAPNVSSGASVSCVAFSSSSDGMSLASFEWLQLTNAFDPVSVAYGSDRSTATPSSTSASMSIDDQGAGPIGSCFSPRASANAWLMSS